MDDPCSLSTAWSCVYKVSEPTPQTLLVKVRRQSEELIRKSNSSLLESRSRTSLRNFTKIFKLETVQIFGNNDNRSKPDSGGN
jgi:hypothetical protein